MKYIKYLLITGIFFFSFCNRPGDNISEFASVNRVKSGNPVSVMLTCYNTTLIANGKDKTDLRIAITDSLNREIISANNIIRIYVTGNGNVTKPNGKKLISKVDGSGTEFYECLLSNGSCKFIFVAGKKPNKVKVEARSGNLWPGSHEIHTIPADLNMLEPDPEQISPTIKIIERMIGADISFLPQLEDGGMKFSENGEEKDVLEILQSHGFNYIRLRIFVNPENENGYSPGIGYCGLDQTLELARRIKAAGMNLLLNFHYSDYWADPQQQNKPLAWKELNFIGLKDSLRSYTSNVLFALKKQGTLPEMVQIGNEINHGMLWPDGHISMIDNLAELLKAGLEGLNAVDSGIPVMMHIALGGQNEESIFWLNNMIARGVQFDIIGISYYPQWHGTLDDLKNNLVDLVDRYNKPINVVEYSNYKPEVHEIIFSLPNNMGKGTCIWEHVDWRGGLFNKNGEVSDLINLYDELNKKYLN